MFCANPHEKIQIAENVVGSTHDHFNIANGQIFGIFSHFVDPQSNELILSPHALPIKKEGKTEDLTHLM